MRVTVEVVGEDTYEFDVEDATYADLLARIDRSPHEVAVLVDGTPVPEDQPVEADHVRVLRLIRGGGLPTRDTPPPADSPEGVVVRRAAARDHLDVLRVVDGANLELDAETAERRIDAGAVVVAVDDGRVVGALVAVPRNTDVHVDAIAVRRRRRAQGIGSALVAYAVEEWAPLAAEFDASVKPFYESLGFDVDRRGDRYRGVLGADDE